MAAKLGNLNDRVTGDKGFGAKAMRNRTKQSYKEHSDEHSRDESEDEKPAKKAAPACEKEPKKAMKKEVKIAFIITHKEIM